MPTIEIDIDEAIGRIGELLRSVENPEPYLQLISHKLHEVARNTFDTNASPDGIAWAPLSKKYAGWKTKRFPGRGMLRLTGALQRHVNSGVTGRAAWASSGPLEYAAIHQFGFNGTVSIPEHARKLKARGRGKKRIAARTVKVKSFSRHMRMPARPILGFPLRARLEVIQDIEEDIKKRFNQEGGK